MFSVNSKWVGAAAAAVLWGCSGSGDGPTGGFVEGQAVDAHCTAADGGAIVNPVDPAVCHDVPDGGIPDTGGDDYGETQLGHSGSDDDCKYAVTASASAIRENADVTFTVVGRNLLTQAPLVGANVRIEAFLNDTHPAPNSGQGVTESAGGTYAVGPVRFDKPGRWTVRFHFYEDCNDVEGSQHGHIAFFVDVP